MNELIENITHEQIYLLKQHLEIFLASIEKKRQQADDKTTFNNGNNEIVKKNENLSLSRDKQHSLLAFDPKGKRQPFGFNIVEQSCFWNYQNLATLALQLVQKVRLNLISAQQNQNRQQELNFENQNLKKRVAQLKQSLERINDFHQKNQQVFDALIDEKQNNSKKLAGVLNENHNELNAKESFQYSGSVNNSFNFDASPKKFDKGKQNDYLRKMISSKQSQIKNYNHRIKQLETQVYCLNLQKNVLNKENEDFNRENITLKKEYQKKSIDYQFLLQRAQAYLQELNFFRLPDKLQGQQEFQMYKIGDLFRRESQYYLEQANNSVKDCDESYQVEIPRLIGLKQNVIEEQEQDLSEQNNKNSDYHYHVSVGSESQRIDFDEGARVSLRKDLVFLVGENQESIYFQNSIQNQGFSMSINSNRQHRRANDSQRSFKKVSELINKSKLTSQKAINTQTDLCEQESQKIGVISNIETRECQYCRNKRNILLQQKCIEANSESIQEAFMQISGKFTETVQLKQKKVLQQKQIRQESSKFTESFTDRIFKRIDAQHKKFVRNRITKFKEKEKNKYISGYFATKN